MGRAMHWQAYLPDGWPGLRAPADPHVNWSLRGEPYPAAWLWVRLPDGGDDLWSSSIYTIVRGMGPHPTREEALALAWRDAQRLGRELEAERDEFYEEWMPWAPLAEIGEVFV